MMNMNTRNYGMAIGRLVRAPKIYENRDGSHRVLYTLAVDREFVGRDGKRGADFLGLEAFIPADSDLDQTLYSRLRVGSLLAASYSVRTNVYTDASGQTRYSASLFTKHLEVLKEKRGDSCDHAGAKREEKGPFSEPVPF